MSDLDRNSEGQFSHNEAHFISVILAVGVKESSRFNNLFTGVNLLVVTYIVICGTFKSESQNWKSNPDEVNRTIALS